MIRANRYGSLLPMVTVANRMTLIEGVGDEVVVFMAIMFLVACLFLAWFSTSVAEQPLIRTAVLVIERRRTSSRINESVPEADPGLTLPESSSPALGKNPTTPPFQPSTSTNEENDEDTNDDARPGTSFGKDDVAGPSHTDATETPEENVTNKCIEENNSVGLGELRKRVTAGNSNDSGVSNSSASAGPAVKNNVVSVETDTTPAFIRIRLKFLNDTQRMVEGNLEEQLGDFKRRYFGEELENDKIVRLIFNGQLLRSDQETLQFYGLFDNCVVHCQISNNIAPVSPGQSETYNELDLSRFMLPLFGVILGAIWYCRIQYRQYFNATSTFALLGITGLFFVSLVALFIPRREHRTPSWLEAQYEINRFKRRVWHETRRFSESCFRKNPSLQRQLTAIVRNVEMSVLSEAKVKLLETYTSEMEENMAGESKLDLDFSQIMNFTLAFEKKAYEWWLWKKTVGKSNHALFLKSIKLWNEGCRLHGFRDCSQYWHSFYEDSNFISNVKSVWNQVKPLYMQLHAYTRRQLIKIHGARIDSNGPIPVHFLGSKFGSNWRHIYNTTLPYPRKGQNDLTSILLRENLNSTKIFQLSENFFVSLGLSKMTNEFWQNSLFQKPLDRKVTCYPSAWDFCDGKDYRVLQCTEINQKNFIIAHHEMGHIQYFMNYARQPVAFRSGANPGFHEAIGDVIGLSVMSNNYLKHYFSNFLDRESKVNFLYMMALEKITNLPFSMLVDMWRWDLYAGKIDANEMNKKWWDMRLKYQGIDSSYGVDIDDFELGGIMQVIKNKDYIRYFVSGIIQFQFYEGLCKASGYNGPLINCNIYGSKSAGRKLQEALRLGSSRPWHEESGLESFNMASIWILVVLASLCVAREHHYRQGNNTDVTQASEFLNWYNNEAEKYINARSVASWAYSSNLTEYNKQRAVEASIQFAKFKEEEVWPKATSFAWLNFSDPQMKRQFKALANLGSASLGDEKLKEFKDLEADMKSIYSKASICSYKSTSNDTASCNLSLDPDLTRIMATSEDYDELQHVWVSWHDAAGKPNRENFLKCLEYETEIARFDGYADLADFWLSGYEDDAIEQEFERLWDQMEPLYKQLHAYVRRKLIKKYGSDKIKEDGPLPAHILGNMWAQSWDNIYHLAIPFQNKTTVDITKAMVEQGYTPLKMFKLAENFFVSLNLEPMPELGIFMMEKIFGKNK
uniref:Angiotensin-converting enzyme n=1 Tax=Strigamia maritima TaxID=126957 RepID=T1ISP9_STRMM